MPLEPLSEISKFLQFLSGRFWPISIRKMDLGSDLGNFYPDAGYGIFFFARRHIWHPGAQFFLLGGMHHSRSSCIEILATVISESGIQ